jgi:microcystin degradation protein MlrC
MRVVIAQMKHETNTYSPVPTPLSRFALGGGTPPKGTRPTPRSRAYRASEREQDCRDEACCNIQQQLESRDHPDGTRHPQAILELFRATGTSLRS